MEWAIIVTHIRLLDRVDLEGSETSANIRWGDPFLASDNSAGVRCPRILCAGQSEAGESSEGEKKSDY